VMNETNSGWCGTASRSRGRGGGQRFLPNEEGRRHGARKETERQRRAGRPGGGGNM
jgi:hypothetical protein